MKKLITAISLTLLLLTSAPNSLAQQPAPKRVLFLGNSVFYSRGGLTLSFEGFCKQANLNYQAYNQWHTPPTPHGINFLNYGRIPLNLPDVAADQNIHALITQGQFDFVILEARREGYLLPKEANLADDRGQPIPYSKNLAALKSLHQTIVQSGAQTVLYMHPGGHVDTNTRHAVGQIYKRFHNDLQNTTINNKRHKVILIPAMYLWLDALNKYSLEAWYLDAQHGTPLARYASSCMIYTYLTGQDPRQNKYNTLSEVGKKWEALPDKTNLKATDEDATWIKNQVWLYYTTRSR